MDLNTTKIEKSFLVIGRAGMDLYADPIGTKIEDATKFSAQLGGSAGNIAVGLARHGCNVTLLAVISNDAIGKFTKNSLKKSGVKTNLLYEVPNRRNTLAIVDTNGENTQAVIYREAAADLLLTAELIKRVNLSEFSTIVTTGTALTKSPSQEAVLSIMKSAQELQIEIILDIDYRAGTWGTSEKAYDILNQAGQFSSVVIGNDVEFDFMAGNNGKGQQFAESLNKLTGKKIIYKMGSKGCILFSNNKKTKFDTYNVEALKPTGAGDAFLAGFCASYVDESTQDDAILKGAATAAIVVSKVGCSASIPSIAELKKFMETHKKPALYKD